MYLKSSGNTCLNSSLPHLGSKMSSSEEPAI